MRHCLFARLNCLGQSLRFYTQLAHPAKFQALQLLYEFGMAFSSGGEFFAYLVLVVFSSSILAYTVRQQRYDILVESLVENEHNNGN